VKFLAQLKNRPHLQNNIIFVEQSPSKMLQSAKTGQYFGRLKIINLISLIFYNATSEQVYRLPNTTHLYKVFHDVFPQLWLKVLLIRAIFSRDRFSLLHFLCIFTSSSGCCEAYSLLISVHFVHTQIIYE
jgi:hypothetical protein